MKCDVAKQKANIARSLARLLSEPDEEMVGALRAGELYRLFSHHFGSAYGKIPSLEGFLYMTCQEAALNQMKEEYRRLFQDPVTGDLWWVESTHKVWTKDPGSAVSFAREKGYLMGDPALHMMEVYRFLGVEVPDEFGGLPDHIILELECLAILLESFPEETTRNFLRDHLDWVPEMVKKGKGYQPSPFYCSVLDALENFIRLELGERTKGGKGPCGEN